MASYGVGSRIVVGADCRHSSTSPTVLSECARGSLLCRECALVGSLSPPCVPAGPALARTPVLLLAARGVAHPLDFAARLVAVPSIRPPSLLPFSSVVSMSVPQYACVRVSFACRFGLPIRSRERPPRGGRERHRGGAIIAILRTAATGDAALNLEEDDDILGFLRDAINLSPSRAPRTHSSLTFG